MKKVGLISDTHGLLRPQALEQLEGSDYIIHAGDIGKKSIIDSLSEIAPVTAVRGNVDNEIQVRSYPHDNVLKIESTYIYCLHILDDLTIDPVAAEFQVVVYGHTHKAKIESLDNVLYVNPGSAGPRRFTLPVTVAKLEINGGLVTAEIVDLKC
ncbi:MAG: metallophosphatase family protein [Granulosicoccus sp.]|nr:metallophosphatase family protein [Granulosicoccus sp.]